LEVYVRSQTEENTGEDSFFALAITRPVASRSFHCPAAILLVDHEAVPRAMTRIKRARIVKLRLPGHLCIGYVEFAFEASASQVGSGGALTVRTSSDCIAIFSPDGDAS
jgi:hypothetical protein